MKHYLLILLSVLALPIFGQNSSTKRVAILETVDKEGRVEYGVKLMVRSKLSAVITATPGYEGYDRVDLSSIMNEHEFQRTGLVNDAQIKRLGEMTGADYILVAEVAYFNSSNIVLSAKILNVETARVERAADTQTAATVEDLEKNCRLLAGKLLNVNAETGAVRGELIINGQRYVGEHKNGKPHGKGIIYYPANDSYKRKSYEGDWVYGKREGEGTLIWNSGERFVGEWKNDTREGYGVDYYTDGSVYEGYWLNDKRHGKGKITFASNDSFNRKYYDGEWLNGVRQGTGTMVWNDGAKYVGGWKNGNRYGKGVHYYANGDSYDGDWVDDKRHGSATYYFNNGNRVVCTYQNDKREGSATYYSKSGRYYAKQNWVGGKLHGKLEYYESGHNYQTDIYEYGVLKKTKKH